jgi:hydroxymethylbilane synthase
LRPDLQVVDLRGNVNTRIRKMQDGDYEAIILACAGMERLGFEKLITETLAAPQWLPAPTQGTIGIQYGENDARTRALLQPLNHADTALRTQAERGVARRLQGSCQVPLAVFAEIEGEQLRLQALVGEADGSRLLRDQRIGKLSELETLVEDLAAELLRQGADQIIGRARSRG